MITPGVIDKDGNDITAAVIHSLEILTFELKHAMNVVSLFDDHQTYSNISVEINSKLK